jgi:hypothetical protein
MAVVELVAQGVEAGSADSATAVRLPAAEKVPSSGTILFAAWTVSWAGAVSCDRSRPSSVRGETTANPKNLQTSARATVNIHKKGPVGKEKSYRMRDSCLNPISKYSTPGA